MFQEIVLYFRFHDVEQEDGSQKYSYNPCNGFIEGKCENAAVI